MRITKPFLKRGAGHLAGAAALGFILLSAGACSKAAAVPEPAQEAKLYLSTEYDETADPAAHVQQAIAEADGRRILLEVGGDWCVWCKILDGYLEDNADVREAFGESFMIVKVNFSREYPNTEFLGRSIRKPKAIRISMCWSLMAVSLPRRARPNWKRARDIIASACWTLRSAGAKAESVREERTDEHRQTQSRYLPDAPCVSAGHVGQGRSRTVAG